jgi:hypothetical protein
MHASRLRTAARRHLVWLLWLMLLLPAAQVAASWHALSHAGTNAPSGAPDPRHAPHVAPCDLCLTGAAIDSGGAPLAPTLLPAVAGVRQALPQTALVTVRAASAAHAYLSRAPPIASS